MRTFTIALVLLAFALPISAQQVGDPDFNPPIPNPAYAKGQGPVVLVDEAHHNFHTATGRYEPFARLLRRDGYDVRSSNAPFTKESLAGAKVLVIANSLAERNAEDWTLPTPSAFTDAEIAAVRDWVRAGGSLLLIADHMPFPGAAEKLAAEFGVRFSNGFAGLPGQPAATFVFTKENGALADHAITRGRTDDERVTRVASFTGSAFQTGKGATSLLTLPPKVQSLEPEQAWQFSDTTPRRDVAGWSQGAVLEFGEGRVAIFGEAAMFTAQLAGPNRMKMGMNHPDAPENARFLLNVVRWLSGALRG